MEGNISGVEWVSVFGGNNSCGLTLAG